MALIVVSQKSLPYTRLQRFSPTISSRTVTTLSFIFMPDFFWATFYTWHTWLHINQRRGFFAYLYPIFPHHLFFKLSSPHRIVFQLCQKSTVRVCIGLLLNSLFCSIDAFFYITILSWLLSFIISLEIEQYSLLLSLWSICCLFPFFYFFWQFLYCLSIFNSSKINVLH